MALNPGERGSSLLRLRLRRDESGYPPYESEQLLGTEVGDHQFRLETVPVFGFGLALGDVVEVGHYGDPEEYWVERLITAGGHSTIRVVPLGDTDTDRPAKLAESHGGVVSTTPIAGLITIDVPPEADFRGLEEDLRRGRERKLWDFSIGVISDEHVNTRDR